MSVTRLANFISIAANPVLLLLGAVMVVINHYVDSTATFWHHSGYAALLLVAPGGLYTIYLWRKVGEIDLDISNREDRIVPMMLTILGAVVGTALLARSQTTSATLETMSYVLVGLFWWVELHLFLYSSYSSCLGTNGVAPTHKSPASGWGNLGGSRHLDTGLVFLRPLEQLITGSYIVLFCRARTTCIN